MMNRTSCFVFATALAFANSLSAATLSLAPTVDGSVIQNGGAAFGTSDTTDGVLLQVSGPLSQIAAFEFDLSSINLATVTAAEFVVAQAGPLLQTPGEVTRLFLEGYSGDGSVTVSDLSTAGVSLGAFDITDANAGGFNTEWSFAIDPLFFAGLGGGLVTLRLGVSDLDGFAGLSIFTNESEFIDRNVILPGVQGGLPPRLNFTVAAVPLPASLPLLLAGLGGVAMLRRRRAV